MRFYLGTHRPHWLELTNVPLFVSRNTLTGRKTLPRARAQWALDSGAFTELRDHGRWRIGPAEYVAEVRRYQQIGGLEWVAPQDWMCEPFILAKTGLTVAQHQQRTVDNFLRLRADLGPLVIPVLQGWRWVDYHLCWDKYSRAGVDLEAEPLVGLGSVCRRQNTQEAALIVRSLAPLKLHGFGIKLTGLEVFGHALASADSMAWSYRARNDHPMRGHTHKSCANCLEWALRWAERVEHLNNRGRITA